MSILSRYKMKIGELKLGGNRNIHLWLTRAFGIEFRFQGNITEIMNLLSKASQRGIKYDYLLHATAWRKNTEASHSIEIDKFFPFLNLLKESKLFIPIKNLDNKIKKFFMEALLDETTDRKELNARLKKEFPKEAYLEIRDYALGKSL